MLSHGLQTFFTDIPLTVIGLILFLSAHASIVARVFFGRKDHFLKESLLPFKDEEVRGEQ